MSKQDCQIRDLQTRMDRVEDRLRAEDRARELACTPDKYEFEVIGPNGRLFIKEVGKNFDPTSLTFHVRNCRTGARNTYFLRRWTESSNF